MKKIHLNNLYESSIPPTRIDVLWVDKIKKEEIPGTTGEIRTIKKYNQSSRKWEPILVNYKDIMNQIENLKN